MPPPRPDGGASPAGSSAGLLPPGGYSAAPAAPGYAQARPGAPVGGGVAAGATPTVDAANGTAQAGLNTGAQYAGQYQDPYTASVVDTTLAGFDRTAAQQQAQAAAQAAQTGAFGGSRGAIQQAQLGSDLALGRAQTEAQLRDQGYTQAMGYGLQDAAQANQLGAGNAAALNSNAQYNAGLQNQNLATQLQAAGLLGDLANSYDSNTRSDLGLMSDLGGQQRSIEQAYASAPYTQLQAVGQLSGLTPYQILTGQQVNGVQNGSSTGVTTTTQSPSLFNQLLSAASTAASFAGY